MLNPDYRDILSLFADEKVEYLIVDAYALAAHGHPRATGDIDLWVNPNPENAGRVYRALTAFGAPLSNLTESDLSNPDLVLQIGVAPKRIDILTSISGVTDFAGAFGERLEVEFDGIHVHVLGRRHLMENKRATGRPQDLVDVERLEDDTK